MHPLARIFHIDPAAACESLMQTALDSGLRLGSMSHTALPSNPLPPCLHHAALRLATKRYEISGLAIIFLILIASTTLSHASPDGSGPGDRFNFSSLVSRSSERILTSLGDLPDGIIPVAVKDEGNQNDPDTGFGMVIQEYSIAQTEVTARQYCNYLNVVATGDNYLLFYNEKMGSDRNVASIKRVVVDGKNQYNVIVDEQGDRGNFPIVHVNLYQAARFCNWLQNQNTPGLKGDALTERGAYTLNGKSSGPIARNPGAVWFIPTENEWYKSAYYKGGGLKEGYWNFANRSDWAPSHSLNGGENSANYCSSSYTKKRPPYLTPVDYFKQSVGTYNTYDMSGNVAEWVATEENQGGSPLKYVARGGSWKSLYYGAAFRSKFDVANWGLELSKSSRPAYDPAQGYDNIGFRVATSLIVNSAPPDKAAPGAAELSPTETVEAPLIALVGIATIFSGKKINDCCRNSERARVTEAQLIGQGWQRTEEGVMTENQTVGKRDPSAVARSGESQQAGTTTLPPSQKKIEITQSKKEEIATCIAAKINSLLDDADGKYQIYKNLLSPIEPRPNTLQEQQEMYNAYDDFATAVATIAADIKTQFPEDRKLCISWYTAAINVAREAVLLRYAAIKQYDSIVVSPRQDKAHLNKEVTHWINDFDQKELQYIKNIKNYQEVLKAVSQEQENPSQQSVAITAFQEIDVETAFSEATKNIIKEREREIQQISVIQETYVNTVCLDYKKVKEEENDNLFPLSFFHYNQNRAITYLVRSSDLREQFKQFLIQRQRHPEVSPEGTSPAKMVSLLFFNDDGKTGDSIGGMNNSQLSAKNHELIDLQKCDNIKEDIVPLNLEQSLEEKDMQFEEELTQGYYIVPRQSEKEYEDNK